MVTTLPRPREELENNLARELQGGNPNAAILLLGELYACEWADMLSAQHILKKQINRLADPELPMDARIPIAETVQYNERLVIEHKSLMESYTRFAKEIRDSFISDSSNIRL